MVQGQQNSPLTDRQQYSVHISPLMRSYVMLTYRLATMSSYVCSEFYSPLRCFTSVWLITVFLSQINQALMLCSGIDWFSLLVC